MKATVSIEYCPKCNWMLRAAYMAQELLTTFSDDLHGVLLQPSDISGSYIVSIDGVVVFNRKDEGRFPEIKELKQLVRDVVNPEKSLGHSDKK
jgi:selenoprotein W-related protein